MSLKFIATTTIEFSDEESLEVFVRTLPLPAHDQIALLDRDEITDEADQAEATGAGKTIHKFKIEGNE